MNDLYDANYEAGYDAGYQNAINRHEGYAWTKLFLLVFIATFFAFAAVAALATYL